MGVKFTDDQQKVIAARNKNILVSAAAGSGKTTVLVERIIQRILDPENPIDIDRLLVVTFTNAAAAGMKDKISKAILDRLNDEPTNKHLQKQAVLVHQAQITTLHSFCLYLVRNHFEKIGLEPDFGIADEPTIKLLSREVMDRILEEAFQKGDPDFVNMVETLCHAGRESDLEELILQIYKRAMSMPFPKSWLMEHKADYDFADLGAFTQTKGGQYLLMHLKGLLQSYVEGYQKLIRISTADSQSPYMYELTLVSEMEFLQKVLEKDSLEEIGTLLPNMPFATLSAKRDANVDAIKRQYVKDKRNAYKTAIQKLSKDFFVKSSQTILLENDACQQVLLTLIDFTMKYMDELAAAKRKKGVVDFNDMEHFALEILLKETPTGYEATEIARNYQEFFEEVMIDEYQDSNMVQEFLVTAVSGGDLGKHNRFMVGDVKQSIYKFRMARPDIFMGKYNQFTLCKEGEQAADVEAVDVRIDLKENFRSREEVLDATNEVFEKVMKPELGGIAYDSHARLYLGNKNYLPAEGMKAELLVATDKPDFLSSKEWEAYVTAKRIKELVEGGFQISDGDKGLRTVTYGDIVLLFRAVSTYQEEYSRVFEAEGIPMYLSDGSSSFDAVEIQTILKLLQVIENPRMDVALFGVCTSFLGGMTENELAKIKVCYQEHLKETQKTLFKSEVCLYDMLTYYRENVPTDETAAKIAILQEKLQKHRAKMEYMKIGDLLYDVLQDFHYREYIGVMSDGERRLANVDLLMDHATNFTDNGYQGLFSFISYMKQMEKQAIEYGQSSLTGEPNAVRVMTIHKSKGLEFPVVFVCGMGQNFSGKDKQAALIIDNDLGFGMEHINQSLRTKRRTFRKAVVSLKIDLESQAEEQRILYVAMTRAKEKLIMIGQKNKFDKESLNLMKQETPMLADVLDAKSYLDLCLLASADETHIDIEPFTYEKYVEGVAEETVRLAVRKQNLEQALLEQKESAVPKDYKERFDFQYPYEYLQNLCIKTSVSDLKKAALKEEREEVYELFEAENAKELYPYIPAFMREKGEVTGAERGTAYHRALELMDFAHFPETIEEWEEVLDGFVKAGRMTERQVDCIHPKKLWMFTQSFLAMRMQKAAVAGTLNGEKSFFLGVPASAVNKDFPADEFVLVQGIIDAYFEEDGDIVLVDYKTDRVETGQELIDRYSIQMQYYVKALEQGLNKKVKEVILYSLALEEEVKLL